MSVAGYAPLLIIAKRPYFGKRQIRNLDQIHKGQLICICDEDGKSVFEVARGPYKENGQWKLDLRFRKDGSPWNRTILLEEHSVIRSSDGNWNCDQWLEKG